MFSLVRYFCILVLLQLVASQAVGEVSPPKSIESGSVVRFGSWERVIPNIYYREASRFIAIDAPTYGRGNPLPLNSNHITVYRKVGTKGTDADFVQVASFERPRGAKEVWIVLVASKGGQLHGVVSVDDKDVFGRGELRIMNVTPYPMVAKIGEGNYEINPLSVIIVDAAPDRKRRQRYALAVKMSEEGWEVAERSMVGIAPSYRVTLIAAITEGFGLVRRDLHLEVLPVSEYVSE